MTLASPLHLHRRARLAAPVAWLATVAFLALAPTGVARAGDFFTEADVGAKVWTGNMADVAAPGLELGVRLGWGPTSWLHLGILADGSTHEATLPAPPMGQRFQLYLLGADIRLGVRVRRTGLFIEQTAGVAFLSTNVLDTVAITEPYRHVGPFLQAGAGVEYHIANPRYAFGAAVDYGFFPGFDDVTALSMRVYLRYTK
jgi:hypothetical protein